MEKSYLIHMNIPLYCLLNSYFNMQIRNYFSSLKINCDKFSFVLKIKETIFFS